MISRDLLLPFLLLGSLSAQEQGDDGEQLDINVENEINGHGISSEGACSGSSGALNAGRATFPKKAGQLAKVHHIRSFNLPLTSEGA